MLTSSEIIKEYEQGTIVIDPFNKERFGPNSYDVALGSWIIRYRSYSNMMLRKTALDVTKQEDLEKLYSEPENITELHIRPYERLLCHTEEFIGTRDKYVPMIATRSTLARWGLDLCAGAGFGDVGFRNRWTLELINFLPISVYIPVGAVIGQVYFEELQGEVDKRYTGTYNSAEWQPRDMMAKTINRKEVI